MSMGKFLPNDKFAEEKQKQQVTIPGYINTFSDLYEHIEDEYEARLKKQTIEERCKRVTFLLDKKLNDELNEIKDMKSKERGGIGWKTMFLNKAVAAMLMEYKRNGTI